MLRANTTQEIETMLVDMFGFDTYYIGLQFYSSRSGTMNRKLLNDVIDPSVEDIYVKLYLKKHPPISQ